MSEFITLHRKKSEQTYYVRAQSIIRIQAEHDRDGSVVGSTYSIGTQFAQSCDETPEELLDLIAVAERWARG